MNCAIPAIPGRSGNGSVGCFRLLVGLALALLGEGCGDGLPSASPSIEVVEPARASAPLLVTEVLAAESPADLLEADFRLINRTTSPQEVSLLGTSCSCYGVLLDGEPWDKGQSTVLEPGGRKVLTFDVEPPAEAGERSWTVRLTGGEEPDQQIVLSLRVRVYQDVTLQPASIFAQTRLASSHESRPQRISTHQSNSLPPESEQHRLVIRRTWRKDEEPVSLPRFFKLPPWVRTFPAVAVNAPQQIADGLWQQTWEAKFEFKTGVRKRAEAQTHTVQHSPSSGETGGLGDNSRTTGEPPNSQSRPMIAQEGIHPFRVAFTNADGQSAGALGRIVVRRPPGLVAPSVVHWGQIPTGSTHKRRIVVSASDGRPFRIQGTTLVAEGGPQNAQSQAPPQATPVDEVEDQRSENPRESDHSSLRVTSPRRNLTVDIDEQKSQARHSIELKLAPRQPGDLNETVIIETDHPLTPIVTLQLRALIIEASPNARAETGG